MPLPSICVTLGGYSVDEMVRQSGRAAVTGADLVEVRFDNLFVEVIQPEAVETEDREEQAELPPVELIPRPVEDVDVEESIKRLKDGIEFPVIFTCRPRWQGGHYSGDEEQRAAVLAAAIESGVSWIDLERDLDSDVRAGLKSEAESKGTKIIASHHDSDRAPTAEDVISNIESMDGAGDIIKLCYRSEQHIDGLIMFEAGWTLAKGDWKYALMGEGPSGDWPRIHAPLLTQTLVYTTLERDYKLPRRGLINVKDLMTAWELLGYTDDA